VITHPAFTVEPWAVRETHLDLDVLAQSESVFALANGHIGCAGTWTRASRSACRGRT
jgi:alpha,alpha-trehalose phosphorylase